jgi:hypothetical protein
VKTTHSPERARNERRQRYKTWALGFGILAILLFWAMGVQAERIYFWRPVQATVVGRWVKVAKGRNGPADQPMVSYRYQVNGRWYSSDQVYPLLLSGGSYEWAQRVTDRYMVGDTTVAYVDPISPSHAFLMREFDSPRISLVAIVLSGLVAVLAAWRMRQLKEPPS